MSWYKEKPPRRKPCISARTWKLQCDSSCTLNRIQEMAGQHRLQSRACYTPGSTQSVHDQICPQITSSFTLRHKVCQSLLMLEKSFNCNIASGFGDSPCGKPPKGNRTHDRPLSRLPHHVTLENTKSDT